MVRLRRRGRERVREKEQHRPPPPCRWRVASSKSQARSLRLPDNRRDWRVENVFGCPIGCYAGQHSLG
eukprot:8867748-Pyramimonas_sp.AAC.2